MVLLDTTVLIDALRARQEALSTLADLVDSGHSLATSAINMGEVYAGIGLLRKRERMSSFRASFVYLSRKASHAKQDC